MAKKSTFDANDEEILKGLGLVVDVKPQKKHTPLQLRVIAGFEEIQKFVDEHGYAPRHGENNDIFERLYAVRLDEIRKQKKHVELLKDLDHQNLLDEQYHQPEALEDLDDDQLLGELGIDPFAEDKLSHLKHVKPRVEIQTAEDIANRTPCVNFDGFKPLFVAIRNDLAHGTRVARPYKDDARVHEGDFFILSGQIVYIAEKGDVFVNKNGKSDSRLRAIYDNGTESNILMRSLQRALNKDDTGRRITAIDAGPLFSDEQTEDDIATGTVYVLRSQSNHPEIKANRDIIHKIGITGGNVEKRISNAKNDPTFLMDDVEVVATYKLSNINRVRFENLIHKFFHNVRFNIEIKDRFGKSVTPQEWFLVPLFVIDEMMTKVKDGSIQDYYYDVGSAKIIPTNGEQNS